MRKELGKILTALLVVGASVVATAGPAYAAKGPTKVMHKTTANLAWHGPSKVMDETADPAGRGLPICSLCV